MKNKSVGLILGLLMLTALAGGLLLVKQNQNTQRGAYFAGTKLLVMPETITGTVDGDVLAQLYVETENLSGTTTPAKISSIDTVVCYGSELKIDSTAPEDQVTLNTEALKDLVDASVVTVGNDKCLRLVAISGVTMKPENLKSGMVKIATIKFKAVSTGQGTIKYVADSTKVGGYNPTPGSADSSLKIGETKSASYTISGSAPSPTPTPTDVPPTGDDSVLNYKVAFANVNGNDAKCVVNWPLQFIVLGGGVSKVYAEVIPSNKTVVDGKLIFSGSLVLTDFEKKAGVAVFVKGPKHLQVKYGKSGQDGPYNKAGGEVTLTSDATTSPVNDFSKYPIIAGDVIGTSSDVQDGWINGVDFSLVKSKSLIHETVDEGGYLKGDLDGNCQVNSNDVNILKISLQAKQGELY